MRKRDVLVLLVGILAGGAIAYVDSRPSWDDAGVTAGALLGCAALLGFLVPRRGWLTALAVGAWVPLLGIVRAANYGSLLALAFAFAGAYGGLVVRKTVAAH